MESWEYDLLNGIASDLNKIILYPEKEPKLEILSIRYGIECCGELR